MKHKLIHPFSGPWYSIYHWEAHTQGRCWLQEPVSFRSVQSLTLWRPLWVWSCGGCTERASFTLQGLLSVNIRVPGKKQYWDEEEDVIHLVCMGWVFISTAPFPPLLFLLAYYSLLYICIPLQFLCACTSITMLQKPYLGCKLGNNCIIQLEVYIRYEVESTGQFHKWVMFSNVSN